MTGPAELDSARMVADAVLYEGYLLYPYRASSSKNQVRWQFGVLGPPAAEPGIGELPELSAECLLTDSENPVSLTVYLRFLQLQTRQLFDPTGQPVSQLSVGGNSLLSWDEAVPHEIELGPFSLAELGSGRLVPVEVAGGTDREPLAEAGRPVGELSRTRLALQAELELRLSQDDPVSRLRVALRNVTELIDTASRDAAIGRSLLGSHLLLKLRGSRFISLLEPPPQAVPAAERCVNLRCWPVLASTDDDLLLVSPIILYDHPEVASQSAGALFDSTEIDEILTLRVLTMTDAEKAEARATDPAAAAIIDRCEAMSAADLQRLHGVLRDPHLSDQRQPVDPFSADQPWWDPAVDGAVSPETDAVLVDGVPVAKGSLVRLQPKRRADAQDLFFDGQQARVTAVFADVDGNSHVAVVLTDDPAADLHEWYGRYLYFAPDELEALPLQPDAVTLNDSETEG